MQIRNKLGVLAAGTSVALSSLAAVAMPALAADTTTTFTLTGGALSVSAPATADLGSWANDALNASAALGGVTVSDLRGGLNVAWTASVTSTDFTTGTATAEETITKAEVDDWSGLATASSGVAVRTAGQATALLAQDLGASRTAYSATGAVGNNVTTWNPTLVLNLDGTQVTGVYTGTVTHSVV